MESPQADTTAPLFFQHPTLLHRAICLFCLHARLCNQPEFRGKSRAEVLSLVGHPVTLTDCLDCRRTIEQITQEVRAEQGRAEASRAAMKAGLFRLSREYLGPEIRALLSAPLDPSRLPPPHLPACDWNLPGNVAPQPCDCALTRPLFDSLLLDVEIREALLEQWKIIDRDTTNRRRQATTEAIHSAANRVLEKIFQIHYAGRQAGIPNLGLDKGIAHHTTTSGGGTSFLERVNLLLGDSPIEVEPRDHYTDRSKGPTQEISSLGFLCCAWQHACDVGFLPELAPWHNVYRPVGDSRRAKKASLILRILEELGRHTTSKQRGWVQVPLTELCDAVGIRRNNPQYTKAGKLLDELAKLGVVWASHALRNRSYRLCAYVRPDHALSLRESPKSTTRTIQKRK